MATLKELNGKAWYRFLKVIFILCYLPYFLFLFIVIYQGGREYHEPILPDTVNEVLRDQEFRKLDPLTKGTVLCHYREYLGLSLDDKNRVTHLGLYDDLPIITPKKKYIYKSYYTWNIMNCVTYGLILTICYIIFMECIRRGFYYIVIGKIFPKE
jgi:hypothetical protein